MRRAVFLDRDGVLIRNEVRGGKPYAITDGQPAELIAGVPEACAMLSSAGFLLVMVTNQPDVATGRTSRRFVEETNARLATVLRLDDVQVCYHDDAAHCECRKPEPGMLLAAAAKFDIDLLDSVLIGDRWRDIEAGRRAGCHTILIDYGYTDRVPPLPDHRTTSLLEAARWWLGADMRGKQ
jgi:D-glycero-D-manno-heptose 1,7-bisphosphate phosphatase